MSLTEFFQRILSMILLAGSICTAVLLASCQSPKVTTTTTRLGLTGARETVVTSQPWVDPTDAALADAMREVMR